MGRQGRILTLLVIDSVFFFIELFGGACPSSRAASSFALCASPSSVGLHLEADLDQPFAHRGSQAMPSAVSLSSLVCPSSLVSSSRAGGLLDGSIEASALAVAVACSSWPLLLADRSVRAG